MGGRVADDRGVGGRASTACNASPLIALAQIGRLDLLPRLFDELLAPPAVVREVSSTVVRPDWLIERALAREVPPSIAHANLDAGERDAIALAIEQGTVSVMLDDRRARRLAESLGIPVIGTVGVLALAKDQGMLPAIRPEIEALLRVRFFLAPDVVARVLKEAGEEG